MYLASLLFTGSMFEDKSLLRRRNNVNPNGDQEGLDHEEILAKFERPVEPITRARAKKLQRSPKSLRTSIWISKKSWT